MDASLKLTPAQRSKLWRDKKRYESKCTRCGFEVEPNRVGYSICEMCSDSLKPAKNSQFSTTIRLHVSKRSVIQEMAKKQGLTITEMFLQWTEEKIECYQKVQEKPEKSSDLKE